MSGGQTQAEIDATMDQITTEHAAVFEGMGRAKVDPIHIQVKKLKEMKEHDLIEGPLPARE